MLLHIVVFIFGKIVAVVDKFCSVTIKHLFVPIKKISKSTVFLPINNSITKENFGCKTVIFYVQNMFCITTTAFSSK